MRRLFLTACLGTLLLASCSGPAPVSVPEAASTPVPLPAAPAHADALRFALIGLPTTVNVWSLYDETGASYANYALHSDEYPQLYRLSIPAREFEPYIAEGMPSAVSKENGFYVASVKLQSGLTWSAGSPLTAQDAAFTVNTALAFHLGLDWLSAYNPNKLDHAEAVDDSTVKFFFKVPFNVGDWQYGALQGPIVSRAYWSPKLTDAASLLPSADMPAAMEKVKGKADILQARINADNAELATGVPNSAAANELNARIARSQDDLNSLNSRFAKLQDEYDAALNAARAALYALADDAEPTFGPFLRATQAGDTFTREVDLTYPFGKPNYDRLVYTAFGEWASAENAFQQNEADVLLNTRGYIVFPPRDVPPSYPTSSARFLAFNPKRDMLADPALRKAIACVKDVSGWFRDVKSLDEFVFAGPWRKNESLSICSGLSKEERIQHAVEILQAAGYSWVQKPTGEQAGHGLILSNGKPFPPVVLLALMPEYDLVDANAAASLISQMQYLGIPVTKQDVDRETLHYAVYSSGDYDMAILGWNLSEYPGYLCDWFQSPSPFAYNGDRLRSACEAFSSTADLGTAEQASYEVQSILMEDLPFIPLYQGIEYEGFRNVIYPFKNVLNGIAGLYGAPALAIPAR